MTGSILTIITSLLAIAIGLWKYYFGKKAKLQKKMDEALDELKKGLKDSDPSRITSGFDRINRVR